MNNIRNSPPGSAARPPNAGKSNPILLSVSHSKKTRYKDLNQSSIDKQGAIVASATQIPAVPLKKKQHILRRNDTKRVMLGSNSRTISNESNRSQQQQQPQSIKATLQFRDSMMSQSSLNSIKSVGSIQSQYSQKSIVSSSSISKSSSQERSRGVGAISLSSFRSTDTISKKNLATSSQSQKQLDSIKIAERKLQESRKKFDLQLKLIRVNVSDYIKKVERKYKSAVPAFVEFKKIPKTQAKAKIQERIGIVNDGTRVQQNIMKVINEVSTDDQVNETQSIQVKEQLLDSFTHFELKVAPYEKSIEPDLLKRDELRRDILLKSSDLMLKCEQNRFLSSANAELKGKSQILREQIAELKKQKAQLSIQQSQARVENSNLRNERQNIKEIEGQVEEDYFKVAQRCLWLRKEICLKKYPYHFRIGVDTIVDNNPSRHSNQIAPTKQSKEFDYVFKPFELLRNSCEMLRSIADLDYFTPTSIYLVQYQSKKYIHQNQEESAFFTASPSSSSEPNQQDKTPTNLVGEVLQNLISQSIECCQLISCRVLAFNPQGDYIHSVNMAEPSSEHMKEKLLKLIRFTFMKSDVNSKGGNSLQVEEEQQGACFSVHLNVVNQQFYLGKEFNIVFNVLDESVAVESMQRQIQQILKDKSVTVPVDDDSKKRTQEQLNIKTAAQSQQMIAEQIPSGKRGQQQQQQQTATQGRILESRNANRQYAASVETPMGNRNRKVSLGPTPRIQTNKRLSEKRRRSTSEEKRKEINPKHMNEKGSMLEFLSTFLKKTNRLFSIQFLE